MQHSSFISRGVLIKQWQSNIYEYIDKAIYNYGRFLLETTDSPDTSENEEFSDALVDVIDLIRNSSIGELELKEEDDYDDEEEEE